MDGDDGDTGAQSFGQVVAQIAEGGLPALLLSKPIQQAFGRLVYAATDVPVAKLQQFAQNVRSNTAAQKQITNAIVSKAKKLAVEDTALVDRSLENWTNQLGRRQKARESVALRSLMLLAETGIPAQAEAPSEDFMGLFEEIAEKASSNELTDLLARILAGEIRRPKSISRRTLQIASILDAEIVEALNKIRPYLFSSNWLYVPPSKLEEWRYIIGLLTSVSIANESGARTLTNRREDIGTLHIGKNVLTVQCKPSMANWCVHGVNLTPVGIELISAMPPLPEIDIEEIGQSIFEHHEFVQRVWIGLPAEDEQGTCTYSFKEIQRPCFPVLTSPIK